VRYSRDKAEFDRAIAFIGSGSSSHTQTSPAWRRRTSTSWTRNRVGERGDSGGGRGSLGSAEPVAEEGPEDELDEEALEEEPVAEEVPARAASRKRSSSSARTARRPKSSSAGKRTASSRAARTKSSSRGR
jgi:hypothetical protein